MTEVDDVHIAKYVSKLQNGKTTIELKKRIALLLINQLNSNSRTLNTASRDDLDLFMETAIANGESKIYVSTAPTVIREVFLIVKEGQPAIANPAAGWKFRQPHIKSENGDVELEVVFTADQLFAVFKAVQVEAEQSEPHIRANLLKNLALAEMIYATGMSTEELADLRFRSLDTAPTGCIWVGDSDIGRRVPVTPRALAAISAWHKAAAHCGSLNNENVFFSLRTQRPDKANTLNASMKRLGRFVEGRGGLTQNSLRDAFAVHLLEADAKPELIAYVLGYRTTMPINRHLRIMRRTRGADAPAR